MRRPQIHVSRMHSTSCALWTVDCARCMPWQKRFSLLFPGRIALQYAALSQPCSAPILHNARTELWADTHNIGGNNCVHGSEFCAHSLSIFTSARVSSFLRCLRPRRSIGIVQNRISVGCRRNDPPVAVFDCHCWRRIGAEAIYVDIMLRV